MLKNQRKDLWGFLFVFIFAIVFMMLDFWGCFGSSLSTEANSEVSCNDTVMVSTNTPQDGEIHFIVEDS